MMVYSSTMSASTTRCDELRESTGSGQYRLVNGNPGTSGGGRNVENSTNKIGYSWTLPLHEAGSSMPAETTSFLVAIDNTVGPGESGCEGILGARFRLEFAQKATEVSCPEMTDVSCDVCSYEGCAAHGALAGSARVTSFAAETAWQVMLAAGRVAANSLGGLAP